MSKKILLLITGLVFWVLFFFHKNVYCKYTKEDQIIDTKAANIPGNYLLKTKNYCIHN